MSNLSNTENRIFQFLKRKIGEIVPYSSFEHMISVRKSNANLRQIISRLRRKKGCLIEVIPDRGIRLRTVKKMPVITHNIETQQYADDIQDAMSDTMGKYADSIGFESQIAIIGVALGALLDQLPRADKDHYTKILIRNVKESHKHVVPTRMQ